MQTATTFAETMNSATSESVVNQAAVTAAFILQVGRSRVLRWSEVEDLIAMARPLKMGETPNDRRLWAASVRGFLK
jgi:hypothetical protein